MPIEYVTGRINVLLDKPHSYVSSRKNYVSRARYLPFVRVVAMMSYDLARLRRPMLRRLVLPLSALAAPAAAMGPALAASAAASTRPSAGGISPYQSPGISPPGANDWSCRPTAAHPAPVVLVHGTFADVTISWNLISPALKRDGYCVFALDYGNSATGPVEVSARELKTFVNRVLSATHAAKV